MARGRTPKPTAVKQAQGNPGKRALNHDEPAPAKLPPECPVQLSAAAKAEWDRLIVELAPLRMLTGVDRAALATYCMAYSMWIEAIESVQQFGTMIKSPSGYPVQSPYVSIANRQAEIMLRVASEFGFTPASRSRISVPRQQEPDLFNRQPANAEGAP